MKMIMLVFTFFLARAYADEINIECNPVRANLAASVQGVLKANHLSQDSQLKGTLSLILYKNGQAQLEKAKFKVEGMVDIFEENGKTFISLSVSPRKSSDLNFINMVKGDQGFVIYRNKTYRMHCQ